MNGYFDYNATAPVRPEVVRAVGEAMAAGLGNPSSAHHAGRRARRALDLARHQVAAAVGAQPRDVVFTSGATESNNLALRSLTTAIEHASVLETVRSLAASGRPVEIADVDRGARPAWAADGVVLGAIPALASIGLANGESGHLADPEVLSDLAGGPHLLHLDAAQALGRIPVDMARLGADLLSISAHKIGGPAGVGALVIGPRARSEFASSASGGPQEWGLRAGTENVAGIVGFALAAELAIAALDQEAPRLLELRERLWQRLDRRLGGLWRLSPVDDAGLPNTLAVAVAGPCSDTMIAGLDLAGFCVSAGAACAAGATGPSHVALALGVPASHAQGMLRFSMGHATDPRDVDALADACVAVIGRAREAA